MHNIPIRNVNIPLQGFYRRLVGGAKLLGQAHGSSIVFLYFPRVYVYALYLFSNIFWDKRLNLYYWRVVTNQPEERLVYDYFLCTVASPNDFLALRVARVVGGRLNLLPDCLEHINLIFQRNFPGNRSKKRFRMSIRGGWHQTLLKLTQRATRAK